MRRFKRPILWSVGLLLLAGLVYEAIDLGELTLKIRRMENLSDSTSPDRFNTVAADTSGAYRFLLVGDTGSGSSDQRLVAEAMEKHCTESEQIHGLLFLGDLIYPKGTQSLSDEKWQRLYMDFYRGDRAPCLNKIPAYPVLGNHDYHGATTSWIHRSGKEPQWRFPGRSWSVHFGDFLTVHGIDSNMAFFDGIPPLPEATSTDHWHIAVGHHPLHSSSESGGRHRGGGLNGWWMERELCGKADAYFSGHAHHLEHRVEADCSTNLFISGAGGADLQELDAARARNAAFAVSTYGFMLLTVSSGQLSVDVWNTQNEKLYRTEIRK